MNIGEDRDWLRAVLYVGFLAAFACVMYSSFCKYFDGTTAIGQVKASSATVRYPSITICPLFNSDLHLNITETDQTPPASHFLGALFKYEDIAANGTVRLVLESKNMSARSEVLYWERYRHFIAPRVQYCLTYDPPGKTKPGRDNSVNFYLSVVNVSYWLMTFHRRGGYLPGLGQAFGSTFVTTAPSGTKTARPEKIFSTVVLTRSVSVRVNRGGKKRCKESDDHDHGETLEECLAMYYQRELGCSYPWLKADSSSLPECTNSTSLENFVKMSSDMTQLGEENLVERTGCVPPCRRDEYAAQAVINDRFDVADFIPDDAAAVQIYFVTNDYMVRTEYFAFNFASLVADFGGYLGLLMGHSLLSLYDAGKAAACAGRGRMNR